ncbi:MAG: rhamnulokinase, partial [Actinobacteria bacterium]|nr:rhamnulokinase [Actinomycetota bacterium]
KVFDIVPRQEIYEYTGIQFMQLNSIFQLFSMVYNDHPWMQIAERLLFMPDLIAFLMTGEKNFEYTMASTSQLLNARSKTWETNLFAKLGFPIELMGSLIQPGTVAGKLLREVTDDTGLPQVDVIAPGSHDTASAVAAVPAKGSNWAYLSSGTWSLLGIETQEPIISKDSLKYNFTNEGGIGNTIRFLRNTMGLWLLQGCRKSWVRRGTDMSYAELVTIANDATPFSCIIDPDDPGFLNPPDMPTAISEYCSREGQKTPKSKGEFVRSIFESLALKYRHIIERINSMREEPIEILHIVGGGSQNEMLNQFAANATGLPVVAGPVEATAIGNILVQAIAKNELHSLQEGRELVARSFPLKKYEPRDTTLWNEFYESSKEIFA